MSRRHCWAIEIYEHGRWEFAELGGTTRADARAHRWNWYRNSKDTRVWPYVAQRAR